MENVCNLLFELSNEDRLNIMLELEKKPMKLTHVAKKLDLTSSESHRQLSRLLETKLVVKDVEGFFSLTPFGEQALKWIPGYTFISDNREYFQSHTLSNPPHDLLHRLGDLSDCMFSNDALVSVSNIETRARAPLYTITRSSNCDFTTKPLLLNNKPKYARDIKYLFKNPIMYFGEKKVESQ